MPRSRLDHYEIIERVGQGGMGIVYKARDLRLGRTVAIKILHPDVSGDPHRRARFEREARAEAALNHPNIATFFDFGHALLEELQELDLGDFDAAESASVTYLVMEHVAGEDLKSRLDRGALSPKEILSYGIQLADALASAHDVDIIHRDLKPGNIRITPEGRVKILDFGLAKFLEAETLALGDPDRAKEFETSEGVAVGTLPYMSPEQIRGGPVDARTDLFSLGVVLYQMATGCLPFFGISAVETLRAMTHEEPSPVGSERSDLPAGLEPIVRRLLAKDPKNRYRSAEQVAEELKELARQPELSFSSVLALLLPPTRRRRRLLAIAGGALLLGLAGTGLFILTRPPPPTDPVTVMVPALINETGDANLDYMADGIGGVLAAQLSRLPLLDVVGWATQEDETADGPDSEAADAAEALLRGTVLEAGERIRTDLRLSRLDSETPVWQRRFTLPREQLPKLFSEVLQDVAGALSLPLSASQREALDVGLTDSAAALDDYLQARHFLTERESIRGRRMAIQLFTRAIEKDPDFALAHAGLSEACWQTYEESREPEMAERAEESATKAVELAPDAPLTRLALARVYRGRGQNAEAIAELRRLIAQQPALAMARYELALVYEFLGDLERAAASLDRALEIRPRWWRAWRQLGAVRLAAGELEAAQAAFERAIRLAPETGVRGLQSNLLAVELYRGDFDAAIELYERLEIQPTRAGVANNLGTAYWHKGRLEEAAGLFRHAMGLDPAEPKFTGNLADTLLELGRPEEAATFYRKAVELIEERLEQNPERDDLRAMRSRYLAKLGRCEEATAAASRLQDESIAMRDNSLRLAQAFALCGEQRSALVALSGAVELGLAAELFVDAPEFESLAEDSAFRALAQAARDRQTP